MAIIPMRTRGQADRNPDKIQCPRCKADSFIEAHYPNKVVYRCSSEKCRAAFVNPAKKDALKNYVKSTQKAVIIIRDKSKPEPEKKEEKKPEAEKKKPVKDEEIKKIVKSAMEQKKILAFQYDDISGVSTVRSVEPYRLVYNEKTKETILFAFCLEKEAIRSFKLSSMSECGLQTFDFSPRWPIEDLTSKGP
jgi:hypothetical protein